MLYNVLNNFLFQINAVDFNFLFFKWSWHKCLNAQQKLKEGSCHTKDWSNDAEMYSALSSQENI